MASIQPLVIFVSPRYNLPVTVEQRRVIPDQEFDSQRHDDALATEDEVLSENGEKVKQSLFQIIEKYQQTNPELVGLLLTKVNAYPTALFNQLGRVIESPIFKAQEGQKGHWIYELTMVDRTLCCAESIKQMFAEGDQFVTDLIFMIVIGDVGKAGPVLVESEPASEIVSRIYNQAIFHQAHQHWLKTCNPDTFPESLRPALAQIDKSEPTDGGLSAWNLIFKNGTFIGLPIEVYLYVLKQVALQNLGGTTEQVEKLFSLTESERVFLVEHGFDPAKTPIRKFFTTGHIQFGQEFLNQEGLLTVDQRELVPLALAHHLSQGELSKGVEVDQLLVDEKQLRTCAYLEILDKVDAVFHRTTVGLTADADESAKQKAVDSAISITQTEIQNNLSRNFSDKPNLLEIYNQVLTVMRLAGVFNFA